MPTKPAAIPNKPNTIAEVSVQGAAPKKKTTTPTSQQSTAQRLCARLVELDETSIKCVSDFIGVLDNWTGSSSPAEQLLWDLVQQHSAGIIPITPESLQGDLKEFTENFELAIENARRLVRRYPIEILGNDCGYEPDQIAALQEGRRGDEQQEAITLEEAREALRKYPSLLVTAKVPEPWRSVIIETYGAEAEEHLSRIEDK
jgi:hypothetical protein